jgi:hypothetical protein
MESPFRSEAAAFRFLLITIGAFALIVLASWISTVGHTFLGRLQPVAAYLRSGPAPERGHVEAPAFGERRARRRGRDLRVRAPGHGESTMALISAQF